MSHIRFSIAQPDYAQDAGIFIRDLAAPALEAEGVRLFVDTVPWAQLWYYIQSKTFERTDIEVSEVGTTWLDSLAHMDVLGELTEAELDRMGGRLAFHETALQGAGVAADPRILSVPWMSDTRVIFYWRDLLEKAGVQEEGAFADTASIRRTLSTLHNAGIPAWGVPTFSCTNTIHLVASWIWAHGGDFLSPDRSRTAFCEPDAILGLIEYFSLAAYMRRTYDSFLSLIESFARKEIAVVMDGPWLFSHLARRNPSADIASLGTALPPGRPFLGGSNLIVWKRTRGDDRAASLALLRFLTTDEVQSKLCDLLGLLSPKKSVHAEEGSAFLGHGETLRRALECGRPLPKTRLWAPLESSLTQTLGLIWRAVEPNRPEALHSSLHRRLDPLAKRFDKMLALF